jgi:hypothetical protein
LNFPAALPLNQWVHVAISFNLYRATVYTNGVALSPQLTGQPCSVGGHNQLQLNGTGYGYGIGCYLDECAWFTNCLSDAEVASIYYAGANSLNMGAPVVYTNNGFVIGLTGVSLPTGQKYYGDGSGLTNLNAGVGSILTNGGNSGSAFFSIDPGVWGTSSEAFGIAANALGNYSFAAGEQAAANGPESTAIGYSAVVNLVGTNGVAIGFQATVTSPNGVAIGAGASTDTGIAIGEGVIVSGPQVVLGNANITNTILQGVVNGNGAGLTNLNASQLSGAANTFTAGNSLIINSNAWNLVTATNGAENFSTVMTTSNGVLTFIYCSNGVAFPYFIEQGGSGGIIP